MASGSNWPSDGADAEEEVAVVAVELGDVEVALLAAAEEALLHRDDVVGVALLDAQDLVEGVGGVDGVAGPGDVAEVVFLAFFEHEVDAQAARLHVVDGVADDAGVTVAGFVEGAQGPLLVGEVFLFVELLAVEEVVEFVGLGLLHRAGELVLLDVVVADEVDFLDADLLALVDGEIDADGVLDDGVALHLGLDFAEQEALLGEVALDDVGGGLLHIFGELAAAAEVEALLDVLALGGLDAAEAPARHARTLLDADDEPGGIPLRAEVVDLDGDVLEVALQIQAADHIGDVLTGNGHFHSLVQACLIDDLLLSEDRVALDRNPRDDIFLRMVVVHFDPAILRPDQRRRKKQSQKGQNPSNSHFHSINIQIYPII